MTDPLKQLHHQLCTERRALDEKIASLESTIEIMGSEKKEKTPKKVKSVKAKRAYKKRAQHIEEAQPETQSETKSESKVTKPQAIAEALKGKERMTLDEIKAEVSAKNPDMKLTDLDQVVSKLYAKGLIKRVDRGIYALASNGAAVAA